MGYLEDAFTELAYDAPVVGGVADYLVRDAPAKSMVPGYGLVSGSALDKLQSTSHGAFYTAVSLIGAAYSDGPFAYFTVKKLSTLVRLSRFTPVVVAATVLVYAHGSGFSSVILDPKTRPRSR